MIFVGRATTPAVASVVLVILVIGTVLAKEDTNVTWKKCKTKNKARVVGILPDDGARHLLLRSCEISEAHPGDFEGFPNLEWLALEYNNISHVDPIVFKSLTKLTYLFLHYNRLTEVPPFQKYSFLSELRSLQLNGNQIKKLDNTRALAPLVKLQLFDVSSNQIDYIHEDMFKNSPNIDIIYLMHNKLRYIPEKLFQLVKLDELSLSNNLIEYVPKDSFLGSSIKELYLHNNRITHLQNTFLSQFIKGSLQVFRIDINSWHCSCLLELIQEIKRAGVNIYGRKTEKYDGTLKVCVIREHKCNRDNFYPELFD